MKKYLSLIILCCMLTLLAACAAKADDVPGGFQINNWSSGLGSVSEENLDESVFSYTLSISSKTEDLHSVTEVYPTTGEKIADMLISNEPPQMIFYDDYIEVSGEIVFDTKGLSKEQIMELYPCLVSVKIITEQTVELTQHVDGATR